jgi:hypothetical protein
MIVGLVLSRDKVDGDLASWAWNGLAAACNAVSGSDGFAG